MPTPYPPAILVLAEKANNPTVSYHEMFIFKTAICRTMVSGKKTIELRKWNTKFRGKFLIHASKQFDKEMASSLNINYTKLSKGVIIGTAELYDVKQYNNNPDFEKDKYKHYANIKKFGSYKGNRSVFQYLNRYFQRKLLFDDFISSTFQF